jgi:hypothetical protein
MRACCLRCGLGTVHGRPSGRCGDSSTEREFPSHKVYRRDDRGIVGVESLTVQGLAFAVIHTMLDARPSLTVPRGLAPPSHGLANRLWGLGQIASMFAAMAVSH